MLRGEGVSFAVGDYTLFIFSLYFSLIFQLLFILNNLSSNRYQFKETIFYCCGR